MEGKSVRQVMLDLLIGYVDKTIDYLWRPKKNLWIQGKNIRI